jgi:hypothetical protein
MDTSEMPEALSDPTMVSVTESPEVAEDIADENVAAVAVVGAVEECSGVHARGVSWPVTHRLSLAVAPCPPGWTGMATWPCTDNATFHAHGPDLSKCVSAWAQVVFSVAADPRSSAVQVLKQLAHDLTAQRMLLGGDLRLLTDAVSALAIRASAEMKSVPSSAHRHAVANEILEALVRTVSAMLDPNVTATAWKDLDQSERRHLVVKLAQAVVGAAELLEDEQILKTQVEFVAQNLCKRLVRLITHLEIRWGKI